MDRDKIYTLVKNNPLFLNFNKEELSKIIEISEIKKVKHGSDIVVEGEHGNELFVLLDGLVEVLKKDEKSETTHQMTVLETGETIGEMALFGEPIRSATVRALQDVDLMVLEFNKLRAEEKIYNKLVLNISKKLSERLRKTGEKTVRALQAELLGAQVRIEMGRFLFIILILDCAWIFAVTILKELTSALPATSFISIPMIFILVFCFVGHVKFSIYPKSYFGLSLQNWKKSIFEGIVFTIPLLIGATILKWALVNYTDKFHSLKIFSIDFIPAYIYLPFLYVLFTPVQEFLARGVLQGSIKASLSGTHTTFWSILLSNLIFASFHAHISSLYALAAFTFGLFWGWLYNRQWTLVSPSISHALIGFWCLLVLGFGSMLAGL